MKKLNGTDLREKGSKKPTKHAEDEVKEESRAQGPMGISFCSCTDVNGKPLDYFNQRNLGNLYFKDCPSGCGKEVRWGTRRDLPHPIGR